MGPLVGDDEPWPPPAEPLGADGEAGCEVDDDEPPPEGAEPEDRAPVEVVVPARGADVLEPGFRAAALALTA